MDAPTKRRTESLGQRLGVGLLAVASLLMLSRLVGCFSGSPTPSSEKPVAPSSATLAPEALLREMIARYQKANSYSDQGRLILTYQRNGQRAPEQAWDWGVQFSRPGKLRVNAYNLHLASNAGEQLVAWVADPESNNIDEQYVVRPAPETVSLATFASDSILFSQLVGRIQRPPVQLELLLGEHPLATLFASNVKLTLGSDETIQKRLCHRLEAAASEGTFIFWIDAENLLLRRLEYPVESLLPELAADPLISAARLIAELEDATFSPKATELDFTMAVPGHAKQVRLFVPPPLALDAVPLGKTPPDFEFKQLDGKTLDRAALEGKPTALFWYAHHPVCEKPAQDFAATVQTLDLHPLLVCTEPPDVGDKAVLEQVAKWNLKLTPTRDLRDYRGRMFQVSELPALTLLDSTGKIQWMGVGPAALAEFPNAVARLQNGEDLASITLEEHKHVLEQYRKLVAAGGPQIDAGILPATQPKRLKLKKAWQENLPDAGGLVAVEDRLFVVASPAAVWEMNAAGEVVQRHALDLPEGQGITAIRAFHSEKQTLFALFHPLQPGVHVYDGAWKLLFSYPPNDPLPVRDVQLGDMNADGTPELLVAFDGTAGLHAVSLAGERLWGNRAYAPLVSIAISHVTAEREQLAYVTGKGGICGINRFENPPVEVTPWSIAHLFTAHFTDATQAAYLAIGQRTEGGPHAIGLNKSLGETWSYPLTFSVFSRPSDFVTSGKLRPNSSGDWLIAWADGSIHVISEDGTFDDHFQTGEELRGIALLRSHLAVTTANGIQCWEVGE